MSRALKGSSAFKPAILEACDILPASQHFIASAPDPRMLECYYSHDVYEVYELFSLLKQGETKVKQGETRLEESVS